MKNLLVLMTLAFVVSGCAGVSPASIAGGECKVFKDPGFAVRGKRLKDDQWIGKTQESGIEVCGWKRPAARPASLDARPAPVADAPAPSISAMPQVLPVATPKKHHWFDKFRRKPAAS